MNTSTKAELALEELYCNALLLSISSTLLKKILIFFQCIFTKVVKSELQKHLLKTTFRHCGQPYPISTTELCFSELCLSPCHGTMLLQSLKGVVPWHCCAKCLEGWVQQGTQLYNTQLAQRFSRGLITPLQPIPRALVEIAGRVTVP